MTEEKQNINLDPSYCLIENVTVNEFGHGKGMVTRKGEKAFQTTLKFNIDIGSRVGFSTKQAWKEFNDGSFVVSDYCLQKVD